MAYDSDVDVVSRSNTGSIHASRSRLKGFIVGVGTNNGSVVFNDGSDAKFTVNVTANTSDVAMNIAEQGVLFKTNLNVTLTNTTITVLFTGG